MTLERGSVAQGFEEADLILDEEYEVPTHSAAPLEPRAALASWDEDHLTVWKSSRGVHLDRASLAEALGLPPDKVQVVGPHIGGGYGNKDESRLAALTRRAGPKGGSAGNDRVLQAGGVRGRTRPTRRTHQDESRRQG